MRATAWVPVVTERQERRGTTADAGVGAGGDGVSVFGTCQPAEWVPVVRGGFGVRGIARVVVTEQRAALAASGTGGTS
ncbi:hypothetical protein [Umezawaea tangerina]|uniref:Uncharacterized protein n=1 Tax=Umezawaea tangerina TaxID=84725 RepID=A0A2T0T805_9PSEU|nr:hypothetical protein [Umezawaea tangerina]PRY41783.1 hypothetical protein CLV43_105542 [Umezawaea tangerina]